MSALQFKIIVVFSWVTCYRALEFVPEKLHKPFLQVTTSTGVVQGTRIKSQYLESGFFYAYMGIPYAQPPVGSLRFRGPKWAKKWVGVLDASTQGSDCVRFDVKPKDFLIVKGNEDCLYLNVYTKENPNHEGYLKPVMVYIYGGGFIDGSSNVYTLGPDLLLSRDVVTVLFNYRLNAFGFLSTEDLASPGNYGLKDQALALRWVQKNIDKFGGDANKVTLFGQSAGSASVHFHMLSPKSSGLFHRAILQSGSSLCFWAKQRRPLSVAHMLGMANGITNPQNTTDLVERLRKIDLKDFKETLLLPTITYGLQGTIFGLPWAPVVEPEHDDAFITNDWTYTQLETGNFNRVPLMIGYTKNETLYAFEGFKLIKPFLGILDMDLSLVTPVSMNIEDNSVASKIGGLIRDFYNGPGGTYMFASYESLMRFADDLLFIRPIYKTVELMSKYVPTYFFCFNYEGKLGAIGLKELGDREGLRGTAHTEELFYLFNGQEHQPVDEADIEVRDKIVTLWTNFAKFNNPTPKNSKDNLDEILWPPFVSDHNDFLDIDRKLSVKQRLHQEYRLNWWKMIFKKFAKPPFRIY